MIKTFRAVGVLSNYTITHPSSLLKRKTLLETVVDPDEETQTVLVLKGFEQSKIDAGVWNLWGGESMSLSPLNGNNQPVFKKEDNSSYESCDIEQCEFELLDDLNQFTQDLLTLHRIRQTKHSILKELDRVTDNENVMIESVGAEGVRMLEEREVQWKLQGKI